MGVEAFFYGYNELWFKSHYPGLVTIDMLLDTHIVSEDGSVEPQFAPYIQEIDTIMSSNKQWSNNIAADLVYSQARNHIPEDIRACTDDLFDLLFWDCDTWHSDRPDTILPPIYHGETTCLLYSAATVSYIVDNIVDLEVLRPFFDQAMANWPQESRKEMGLRNLDDFNTFLWWVDAWFTVFNKVAVLGKGNPWALMIYIWY